MNAHDKILSLVRSTEGKRRFCATAGMRIEYGTERKLVLALDRTEPKPGSTWERQDVVFASGDTWEECWTQLVDKGYVVQEKTAAHVPNWKRWIND